MKTNRPTTQSPHRKRRPADEAAASTEGRAEAPAQALAALRSPQVSADARGRAALGLQRAVGNVGVGRVVNTLQRYTVEVAPEASCDEVIDWINTNSPYAPEWAHTEGNPRWTGSWRITGNLAKGFRLRIRNPQVTLDGGTHVDMPEWQPSTPAMRRAWQSAIRNLRAHEARHEQIARQWRQRLQQRLAQLSLKVEAASRDEVEAQAQSLVDAEWAQWIIEYQQAQQAIDPFTATLHCPTTQAEQIGDDGSADSAEV